MKEGIIVRPQIKYLFENWDFSTKLNATGRRAWEASGKVCRKFLGTENREKLQLIFQELISSYSVKGCNISLEINVFLTAHHELTIH